MSKKLYLLLALTTICLMEATDSIDQSPLVAKTSITKADRIKEAKQKLMLDMQTMLLMSRKALSTHKEAFKDAFELTYERVMKVVHRIVNTPEHIQAMANIIELQKNHILYDTVINEEDLADHALINKVNELLTQEFPSLDENIEKLFNIMYVTISNLMANKQLLNALDAEAKKLAA